MALTAMGTTALCCGALFVYEMRHIAESATVELTSVTAVVAENSTAALAFADSRAGAETLAALRSNERVLAARIYDRHGHVFATFRQHDADVRLPDLLSDVEGSSSTNTVIVTRPVELAGEQVGTVVVIGSSNPARAQVREYAFMLTAVAIMSTLVAILVARRLQGVVSDPLLRLASVASQVSATRDYGVRAARETNDELGILVDRFNEMMGQIQQGEEDLRLAKAELEDRVVARTTELQQEIRVRRYTEDALTEAKEAAEAASLAKSAFLANMSHELRTPLNAIIGYSEMLQEEAEERALLDLLPDLRRVRSAGKHLLALINDILDLSKIDAGRMELSIESFEADAMLGDVVATAAPLADRRKNSLSVAPHAPLGLMRSDPTRVRQVLLNLLGNACKFTENGQVTVSAERRRGTDGDILVFSVADTGIGIPPEAMKRLFREFSQADASTTRKFGGTGLGLAISHRLCEMLGGDIAVRSLEGQGSTFTVTLPAEVAARSTEDRRVGRMDRAS